MKKYVISLILFFISITGIAIAKSDSTQNCIVAEKKNKYIQSDPVIKTKQVRAKPKTKTLTKTKRKTKPKSTPKYNNNCTVCRQAKEKSKQNTDDKEKSKQKTNETYEETMRRIRPQYYKDPPKMPKRIFPEEPDPVFHTPYYMLKENQNQNTQKTDDGIKYKNYVLRFDF